MSISFNPSQAINLLRSVESANGKEHNGKVTKDGLENAIKSGKLDETQQKQAKELSANWKKYDKNGNQKLSLSEIVDPKFTQGSGGSSGGTNSPTGSPGEKLDQTA